MFSDQQKCAVVSGQPMAEEIDLEVRVNDLFVGYITIPEAASKRVKLFAALSLPETKRLMGESTIKGNPIFTPKSITIPVGAEPV